MIYVTGDIHGGCTMNNIVEWEEGKNLTHDDYLVIAGDFGIPWEFSITEDDLIYWIESRPWTTLFVDGNHERFSWWKDQPIEEWHGGTRAATFQVLPYSALDERRSVRFRRHYPVHHGRRYKR